LLSGTATAFVKLRRFRPQVVFSTGGYASFPASLAAWVQRRPLVVYLPDVSPGWAVKAEMRLATRLATSTEAALAKLPAKKTVVTGYPVRPEFVHIEREAARRKLGFDSEQPVIVIAGASQGASAINNAVFEDLDALCSQATVVHVTGAADLQEAEKRREGLPDDLRQRYQPAAYREDLPVLMVAADLGVFRAGASVLGEVPAACLPSILVPGTFAGGHQRDNAVWLQEAGAAEVLEERDLDRLASLALELLCDRGRLAAMRAKAGAVARPDAAERIADLILEVAKR
jgi:UDP-N-acetylglucosamine--N-acetylmuramyl-(pentapeptide) pyrophosphoryl-undecaprenol N-acetylglucosamine transferase